MVRIVNAEFLTSAAKPSQAPDHGLPEIAMAGRSNVGKSSLINALCNRRNLAKTSGTPGKTRLLNFFQVELREPEAFFCIVDLPGYGYAKASKTSQEEWNRQTDRFLAGRTDLSVIIHLLDCRHDPTQQDWQMRDWLAAMNKTTITALTKADKLSRQKLANRIRRLRESLQIPKAELWIPCSAVSKQGLNRLLAAMASAAGFLGEPQDENPV